MIKSVLLLSFVIFFSCNSDKNSEKEKDLLKKENELLQKENELLKEENANKTETGKAEGSVEQQNITKTASFDWLGTWEFEKDMVGYTLNIEDKFKGANICKYEASGIQTFYKLECKGIDKGSTFELYYWGTDDGAFYQEDRINRDKPILTLKHENGKVITHWDQLIGGENGRVCFKRANDRK